MGKSAQVIGREEFGLNAKDMNSLLKKHGYLRGEPGPYSVTEKGEPFATERWVTNGVGGYRSMQVNYDVRTWNEDLPAALRADMDANPDGVPEDVPIEQDGLSDNEPTFGDHSESGRAGGRGGPEATWKELAVAGALLGGIVVAVRYGPTIWREKVKPAGKKLRARFSKQALQDDAAPAAPLPPEDTLY